MESFLEYIDANSKNGVKPDAPKPVSSAPVTEGTGHHDELCKSSSSFAAVAKEFR